MSHRRLTREERRARREQIMDILLIGGITWMMIALVWVGFMAGMSVGA